ncbi:zinc ribbon domain-containing protein [Limosilactobacillus fermentum]
MVESAASNSKGDQFAVSLVTPWIKGTMDIDESFLQIDMPNTVLFGMLPAGKSKDSTPLSGVTNVYTSNSYKIGAIILGAFVLLGLSMIGSSIVGALILILIGVAIFGSGIKTTFSYERSGIAKSIDVPFFEANHVREFEEKVLARIQGFQDDRNVRMQTQKSMAQSRENDQAIVDAVKGKPGEPSQQNQPAAGSMAFCPNYGEGLGPGAKFCTHCGTKIV